MSNIRKSLLVLIYVLVILTCAFASGEFFDVIVRDVIPTPIDCTFTSGLRERFPFLCDPKIFRYTALWQFVGCRVEVLLIKLFIVLGRTVIDLIATVGVAAANIDLIFDITRVVLELCVYAVEDLLKLL